jgi:hypothetical protein
MAKRKEHAAARTKKAEKRKRRKLAEKKQNAKRDNPRRTPTEQEQRLIVPHNNILRPMTQFERRMMELSEVSPPPPPHLQSDAFRANVKRAMDSDLQFQIALRKMKTRAPLWAYTRRFGGSGLVMAETIRQFLIEYWDRVIKHGPHGFPTSFNVLESFLVLDRAYAAFDLRPEVEHLLDATDYFQWYSENALLRKPALLLDAMPEGVVYSYNMVNDSGGYQITSGRFTRVVAGVAFVRHKNELSCILVAGEQPPTPSDDEIDPKQLAMSTTARREDVRPDPDLGIADRYLETFPGFVRVLLLTRIDLTRDKYDVRYVNVDLGTSYLVFTDDEGVFDDMPADEMESTMRSSLADLQGYDDLFSLLASLMYLPVLFVDKAQDVAEVAFKTELSARRTAPETVKAIKLLGQQECVFERTVRCLPAGRSSPSETLNVTPPELTFESSGYWKKLEPGLVGEDEDGKPIVGKTWVERTENWSSKSPSSFVLHRPRKSPEGKNPGVIYVMRTPVYEIDVYKIGLTTRTADERARELYSTGVALPFGVLVSWEVGDCVAIEAEVHQRLAARRVSARREFFRSPIGEITETIMQVIEEMEPQSKNIPPLQS